MSGRPLFSILLPFPYFYKIFLVFCDFIRYMNTYSRMRRLRQHFSMFQSAYPAASLVFRFYTNVIRMNRSLFISIRTVLLKGHHFFLFSGQSKPECPMLWHITHWRYRFGRLAWRRSSIHRSMCWANSGCVGMFPYATALPGAVHLSGWCPVLAHLWHMRCTDTYP